MRNKLPRTIRVGIASVGISTCLVAAPASAQLPKLSLPWTSQDEAATSSPWTPPEVSEPAKPSVGQRVKDLFAGSPLVALLSRDRAASAEEGAVLGSGPTGLATPAGQGDVRLLISMAQMHEQQGDIEAAREHFKRAIALSPDNLDVLLNVARLEDRQGRLEVAEMLYGRAVSVDPQSAAALNDLGLCVSRQDRVEQSVELLQRAIRLQPQKALYRNNLATVLIELGRDQEALTHLTAVHDPAVANYNMGQLLLRRGRVADAPQYFTTALQIDPTMESARAALTWLQASQPTGESPQAALPPGYRHQQPVYAPSGQSPLPSYAAPGQNAYVADRMGGVVPQQVAAPGSPGAGMPQQQSGFYGAAAQQQQPASPWPAAPSAASRHLPAVDAGR